MISLLQRPGFAAAATASLLLFAACSTAPKESTPQDESDQFFSSGADFAGSHILVAYKGATRASDDITRTKEEALARAKEITERVKKNPDAFADIAKEESDGPSAATGGSLGEWNRGRMVPEFDDAISKLEVGEITDEPVETGFGYHIIIRQPVVHKYYAVYGFIISWSGLPQLPEIVRSKEQADSLAQSLKGSVNADNFDEMAAEYNDVTDRPIFLGAFTADNNLPDGLLDAVKNLKYGEVAGPFEFPIGYAFVKRVKAEQYSGSHILISYEGAQRARESTTRSKEEAEQFADELAEKLQADPSAFAQMAADNSDDTSGPEGGTLGTWFRGSMVEVFDSTIATLQIGEITAHPVESPFGYHIIRRDSVAAD